jgi:hypothetical protein
VATVAETDDQQLGGFFDYIWEGVQGYAYLAHKIPENQYKFQQTFFRWPDQRLELINHVLAHRTKYEVYFAPALFSAPSAQKEQVYGAKVFWCEFDGKVPSSEALANAGVAEPTLKIMSSEAGHEHWYWKVDKFLTAEQLDRVNRALTYLFGADTSGWDANQILRPPLTFNHKRQRPVVVYAHTPGNVLADSFIGLPEPPPPIDAPLPESIPDINEVIMRYKFPDAATRLFKMGVPVGKRSSGMMSLGFYLAEMNLTNPEMLAVLLNADQRWGKFSGRTDQLKRLMEIVTIARQKFPWRQTDQKLGVPTLQPMGFLTLLKSELHVEWYWDGWLQDKGYMLLTGPSQVGKTQLALDVAGNMALGRSALDSPTRQGRIGFFSLEMNAAEIKEFMQLMATSYTPEQQQILEQNLLIFPLGEPLYLNKKETREQVEQTVADFKLDGIIVDSMGSTTDGSLSDEVAVRTLIDWNDSFRQRSGAFTWFIHHHRKGNGDNKKPNKLDDVYGNMYITARATSVICLWQTGITNTLDFIPLKVRLRANPGRFHIKRGADLRFTRLSPGVVNELVTQKPDTEEEGGALTDVQLETTQKPEKKFNI